MARRFAGSAPRREHGDDAALGPRQAEPKACDEARRRGFGDDRRGRSVHEMPKRAKSEERRDGQSNDVDNANGGVYLPRDAPKKAKLS